jgi:uroporphyrinogen III methyltransferase/synthase
MHPCIFPSLPFRRCLCSFASSRFVTVFIPNAYISSMSQNVPLCPSPQIAFCPLFRYHQFTERTQLSEVPLSSSKSTGHVSLVGAGPGDPGLFTLRGLQLLKQAEVVVFDYLANPALLKHCPKAETIYVGKSASRHAMTQDQINQLLVDLGKKGKRVVRLKGGDPFVFGRGGEEAQVLAENGVAFDVVPGITSAIAATCYAGIPITHRDSNSSMTLITGHEKEAEYQEDEAKQRTLSGKGPSATDVDWGALAKLPCIAFYMGVKALPSISRNLIEHGMWPEMPAATIQWGSTPRQRTIVGTISTLPELVAKANLTPPAITVVGKMVLLREKINWFETRALFGQTIIVTRTRQQASELSTRLEELGARVLEAPTIELRRPVDMRQVDAALKSASTYDWIIFTSANGVTHTRERLLELGLDVRAFGKARVASVGDATTKAIQEQLCLQVDLAPKAFVAEALAEELAGRGEVKGKRFLLLRADIARPILRERLEQGGASAVDDISVYESHPVKELPAGVVEAIKEKQVQWVTFTSSATAKNFVNLLGTDYRQQLGGVKIASIGPITTATLKELGLSPTLESQASNIDGLVEAIRSNARPSNG